MSYNPSIPLRTDFLSVSQGQIKTNFSQLNTVFGNDHVPFDSGTNPGLHNHVTIPNASTDPTISGNTIEMYMKALGGIGAPFLASSASTGVMWSGGTTYPSVTAVTGGNGSNGYIRFPNGIMIQWGNGMGSGSNPYSLNFATPFANACFAVIPVGYVGSNLVTMAVRPGALSKTAFQYQSGNSGSIANVSVMYIAIGN
jgi:hypothetical protein